jgi:hypothetical protein
MSTLVRVFTPERDHRHEGLVICRDHLRQVVADTDPPFILADIADDQAVFLGQRCLMCVSGIEAPGRTCESDSCVRPLHPQWPAVYCCNACALDDV